MIHVSRILVIIGSTRAKRICPQIAQWVARVGRETIAAEMEVVDLKDWPLPMDDEPGIPAVHDYAFGHTSAWSRKISGADALVFVTPQYNWGYPAPLKKRHRPSLQGMVGKPAMIVSYGSRGGGKCAGQLRQVLKGLDMRLVATMPGFRLAKESIKANSGVIEPERTFAKHRKKLRRGFAELDAIMRGGGFANWLKWPW